MFLKLSDNGGSDGPAAALSWAHKDRRNMNWRNQFFVTLILVASAASTLGQTAGQAAPATQPPAEQPKASAAQPPKQVPNPRLDWWREARFGMFIHWGLYAIPAGEWKGKPVEGIGEWVMNHAKIPVTEYEQLARQFNPVKFNAYESRSITKAEREELLSMVHQYQPTALVSGRVGNNAGDYDTVGDNQVAVGPMKRDWEAISTTNDTWGYKKDDNNWKPASVLIRQMAHAAGHNGNYLLNVGPTAERVIPPAALQALQEVC